MVELRVHIFPSSSQRIASIQSVFIEAVRQALQVKLSRAESDNNKSRPYVKLSIGNNHTSPKAMKFSLRTLTEASSQSSISITVPIKEMRAVKTNSIRLRNTFYRLSIICPEAQALRTLYSQPEYDSRLPQEAHFQLCFNNHSILAPELLSGSSASQSTSGRILASSFPSLTRILTLC